MPFSPADEQKMNEIAYTEVPCMNLHQRTRFFLLLFLVLFIFYSQCFLAFAAHPAQVAQTGQTVCWDASGASISCLGTGQDGELKAG